MPTFFFNKVYTIRHHIYISNCLLFIFFPCFFLVGFLLFYLCQNSVLFLVLELGITQMTILEFAGTSKLDFTFLAFLHFVSNHLPHSLLNLAFAFGILNAVNVLELNIPYPCALITEATHSEERLIMRPLIRECAKDKHSDAVRIVLGPKVEATAAKIIVDNDDRVSFAKLRIHRFKELIRCIGIDCHYVRLLS